MSKSWKKILVTGASLLMFASVSVGLSSNSIRVSAKSGHIVRYEGENVHLGNGNARKSWLLHGQRLKLYNYKMRDDNGVEWSASKDGFIRMSDVKPLHYRHYRKHTRKHYRRLVKKAKKHVIRKRKFHKAHKAKHQTKRASTHKLSRSVCLKAEKLSKRLANNNLKIAKLATKVGHTKIAKKARQKANYFNIYAKHCQTMANLVK